MRGDLRIFFVAAAAVGLGATAALAHAFIDHASPPVGRTVSRPPTEVRLWFSEQIEPAFSRVQVLDGEGRRVDRGDTHVDPKDATQLTVSLQPLPPGSYKVAWRVVSVDTHVTEGRYTFKVAGP